MADETPGPDEDLPEIFRQLFGGAGMDPEQLAELSKMGFDPAMLQSALSQLQGAFASAGHGGISWELAERQALHIANKDGAGIGAADRSAVDEAFTLASLWLGEATAISDIPAPGTALTRGGWVEATLPVWQELAEPVATSIADAFTAALQEQAPDDLQGLIANAGKVMRTVGGSLFATQLGKVVGDLSTEVVSGGDVGIPLLADGHAAVIPQNFAAVTRDLDIPDDQFVLYVATRELAHARLFRHARWLRLHVLSQVSEFARGVRVDTQALEDMAGRFDPAHPEELREALETGALLPERSDAQKAALSRLETTLATIEGWVDVVTEQATSRLPAAARIAETVRRRRAIGGPAEQALGALVGLELRPRRIREAAAMWRAVADAVGIAARDELWDSPDLVPTAHDIDDPAALVARLTARARGEEPVGDEFDDALARLLAAEDPAPSAEDDQTDEPTEGTDPV
ncbi:zinc-dependent metalloprotease [Microbacterium sediminicola]|uniref:Zinc-dependent metalloprotease n=1 Tax=Microbacterium sediminicola TaxID=415210 RepID=A0ABP4TP19_9MICO